MYNYTFTNSVLAFCFCCNACHQLLVAGCRENFFSASACVRASAKGLMSECTAISDLMLLWNSSGEMSTYRKISTH